MDQNVFNQIEAELDEMGLSFVRAYRAMEGDLRVIGENDHGQYRFRVIFYPFDEIHLVSMP